MDLFHLSFTLRTLATVTIFLKTCFAEDNWRAWNLYIELTFVNFSLRFWSQILHIYLIKFTQAFWLLFDFWIDMNKMNMTQHAWSIDVNAPEIFYP